MMRLYLIAADTPRALEEFSAVSGVAIDAAIEVVPLDTAKGWDGDRLRAVLADLEDVAISRQASAPATPEPDTSSPPDDYTPIDWN